MPHYSNSEEDIIENNEQFKSNEIIKSKAGNNEKLENQIPFCVQDSDCPERYFCNENTDRCQRNKIFPLQFLDYVGIVCLILVSSLATSAGIGGGEIMVPAFKAVFQYIQLEASTLPQCCIMMASLTRFILYYNRQHPFRNTVAIEYKVVMLIMPSIFFGVSFGVMLHKIIPNFLQEIFLLLVLILCFYESIKKGILIWKQENVEKKAIPTMKTYTLPSLGLLKSESPKPLSDSDSSDSFLFIPEPVKVFSTQTPASPTNTHIQK